MKKAFILLLAAASVSYSQNTFSYGSVPVQQSYPVQEGYPMQGSYPVQRMPMQGGGMPMGGGIPVGGAAGGIPIAGIIGLVGALFQTAYMMSADKKRQQQQDPFDINTAAGDADPVPQPRRTSTSSASRNNYQQEPEDTQPVAASDNHMYSNYFDDEEQQEDREQTRPVALATTDKDASTYEPGSQSVYHKVGEQQTSQGVRTYYATGPFDKVIDGVPNGIVLENGNIKSPFSDYTIDVMESPNMSTGKIITDPKAGKKFRIPGYNE